MEGSVQAARTGGRDGGGADWRAGSAEGTGGGADRVGLAGLRDRAGQVGDQAAQVGGPAGRAEVRDQAADAGRFLLALLLMFLRDHGQCGWRRAGISWPPTHLAVVPSGRGRVGPHPLRALIAPYLRCRWTELIARPDHHRVRELDPDRFEAAPVPDGRILLLDDTWTTGASAQSAVMALRRAGAGSVAVVVLGRHINPEYESIGATGPGPPHAFSLEGFPFLLESCAVHTQALVE